MACLMLPPPPFPLDPHASVVDLLSGSGAGPGAEYRSATSHEFSSHTLVPAGNMITVPHTHAHDYISAEETCSYDYTLTLVVHEIKCVKYYVKKTMPVIFLSLKCPLSH